MGTTIRDAVSRTGDPDDAPWVIDTVTPDGRFVWATHPTGYRTILSTKEISER